MAQSSQTSSSMPRIIGTTRSTTWSTSSYTSSRTTTWSPWSSSKLSWTTSRPTSWFSASLLTGASRKWLPPLKDGIGFGSTFWQATSPSLALLATMQYITSSLLLLLGIAQSVSATPFSLESITTAWPS